MITDAASGWLVVAEDEGNDIPAATDTRAVRKNVSLPAWMATLAEKRGANCSQVEENSVLVK